MVQSEDPRDGDRGSTPRRPCRPCLEAPRGLALRGERPDLSPFTASLVPKIGGTSPVHRSARPPVSKQKRGTAAGRSRGRQDSGELGLRCDCGLAFARCSDPDAGHGTLGPRQPPPAARGTPRPHEGRSGPRLAAAMTGLCLWGYLFSTVC